MICLTIPHCLANTILSLPDVQWQTVSRLWICSYRLCTQYFVHNETVNDGSFLVLLLSRELLSCTINFSSNNVCSLHQSNAKYCIRTNISEWGTKFGKSVNVPWSPILICSFTCDLVAYGAAAVVISLTR